MPAFSNSIKGGCDFFFISPSEPNRGIPRIPFFVMIYLCSNILKNMEIWPLVCLAVHSSVCRWQDGSKEGRASRLSLWSHPGNDVTGMIARSQKVVGTCQEIMDILVLDLFLQTDVYSCFILQIYVKLIK